MSTWRPSRCKVCGASKSDTAHISRGGLCEPCSWARERIARQASIEVGKIAREIHAAARATKQPPASPKGVGGTSKRVRTRRPKAAS